MIFKVFLSLFLHSLDYSSFIISLEIRLCKFSNLVVFENCFGFSRSFASLYKSISTKKNLAKILIGIVLNP